MIGQGIRNMNVIPAVLSCSRRDSALLDRMILVAKVLLLTAAFLVASVDLATAAESAERIVTADTLQGQYSIGAGPSRTELSLTSSGTFTMSSRADLGTKGQLHGRWHLIDSDVVLWVKQNGRVHRWGLRAFPHGDGFDLVPEETVSIYAENPQNIGGRYRRLSPVPSVAPKVPDAAADAASHAWSSVSPPAATPKGSPKAGAARVTPNADPGAAPARSAAPPDTQAATKKGATDSTATASSAGSAESSMMTSFVYKPAPQTPIDTHLLRGPGLARLSIDEGGKVTNVTILQSTGHRPSDAEAVDTFTRWKAKPGNARDVELPLVWAAAGKRIPTRVGTSAGSMTSG